MSLLKVLETEHLRHNS